MKSVSEFCEILQKNSIAELLQTTTLLVCQDLKTTAVIRTRDPWYRIVRNSAGSRLYAMINADYIGNSQK